MNHIILAIYLLGAAIILLWAVVALVIDWPIGRTEARIILLFWAWHGVLAYYLVCNLPRTVSKLWGLAEWRTR